MKHIIAFIVALLLAPLPGLRAAAEPVPRKPNIVFIYADDWGWGDLSCHGNTWLKTPRLDKLASEGIDFQQFNVLSPICSPSRAAALTGRFPGRFGINTVFGVGKPPELAVTPVMNQSPMIHEARFKNFDANVDGNLTREEFVK